MLRYILFFCFCVLATGTLRAQKEDFFKGCLDKATSDTYTGYAAVRYCLYVHLGEADTLTAHAVINRLRQEAADEGNPRLNLYADDAHIEFVLMRRQPVPLDSIVQQRETLVAQAERFGEPAYIAWAEQTLANALYLKALRYDRAFEMHLRAYNRLRHLSDAEMPDKRAFLATIGHHYYEFAEYRHAIHFLSEAVGNGPLSDQSIKIWQQGYNTLGLCYRQLGRYDSSDYYFEKSLHTALNAGDGQWAAISHGNLGINLYRRGHYDEAAPLLTEDLRASTARGDLDNAAGALLPLAGMALAKGNVAAASAMLDTAREYISRSDAAARLPLYYALRNREAAGQGNARLAASYLDSFSAAKDSVAHQFSALHLLRAEQRLASAELRSKLLTADAQQRLAVLQRNALVVTLALAAGLAFFGWKYFRQRRREAAEKSAAALRLKEAELEASESALNRFRKDVQEKAALIEQLSIQLDEGEHSAILQQLRDATILTDAQWAEFRRLFEQVHSGFIARLSQQYAGLTPAEVRYLVLARLGFSTKEMAGALGISASTIRVVWHRLRKKLGLNEEAQAGALVEGI